MANWTPTQFGSRLYSWHDASDTSTVSGTTSVTQFRDKSGNTRHFNAVGSSNNPATDASSFNSQQSLRFTIDSFNAGHYLQSVSTTLNTTTLTVYVAAMRREATTNDDGRLFGFVKLNNYDDNGVGAGGFYLGTGQNTSAASTAFRLHTYYSGTSTASEAFVATTYGPTQNQGYIYGVVFNGSSFIPYGNGNAGSTGTQDGSLQYQYMNLGANVYGGVNSSSAGNYYHATGDENIGEVVVVTGGISTSERQQLEGYLAWKWGTQTRLPTSHPYYNAAPTVGPTIVYGSTALYTTSATPWDPSYYPAATLNGWWDPSVTANISTVSGNVTTLRDTSSGAPYNFTSYSTGSRPAYLASGINGLGVLNYGTSNNKFLISDIPSINNVRTYVAIVSTSGTSTSTTRCIFGAQGAGGLNFLIGQTNNYLTLFSAGVGQLAASTTAVPTSGVHILVGTFDNTNGNYSFRINGTTVGSGNTGSANPNRLGSSSSGSALGFNFAAGIEFFQGYMGETLALASSTLSDIQIAEGYIAWKWGTQASLPSGHPYKNAAPMVSGSATAPATSIIWTPDMLSVPPLKWFDASDTNTITQNSSNIVSVWGNKGQEPGNLTLYGTYTGPKYDPAGFNGLPAIVFDGTNYLDAPVSINNSPMCVFVVLCQAQNQLNGRAVTIHNHDVNDYDNTASAVVVMADGTTNFLPENFRNNTSVAYSSAIWNLPALSVHGYTGSQGFVYGNGGTSPTTYTISANVTGTFLQIGGRNNAGATTTSTADSWIGPIAEVIVIGHNPTVAERQIYEGYLAWKWGLYSLLPAAHPYKNNAPPAVAPLQPYTAWSPYDLPTGTLQGWYSANEPSTLTVAANTVSQWRDRSGRGRHLNQATGAYQPTYNATGQNGFPAVISNGSQFMRTTTGMAYPAGTLSVFILGVGNSSIANARLFSAAPSGVADTGAGGMALTSGAVNAGTLLYPVAGTSGTTANYSVGSVHIFSGYLTTTTAGSALVDGGFFGTSGSTTANASASMDVASIFAPATTGTTGWNGSITEMIVVSGVLSTADRQKIEGYLASKSGQTDLLSTTHPYRNSPPVLPYVRRRITMIES